MRICLDDIEYSKLVDRNKTLNSTANKYFQIGMEVNSRSDLYIQAQELIRDISKYLDVKRCKTISASRYDSLIDIVDSWRRYFVSLGITIEVPEIPDLTSIVPTIAAKKSDRQKLTGKVIKISGTKTIKVEVLRSSRHPIYGKEIRTKKNYMVHDENQRAKVGDEVIIVSCRPMSKTKCFRLFRIKHRKSTSLYHQRG